MKSKSNAILFAMHNSLMLGNKISKYIKLPLGQIRRNVFSDGEFLLSSKETVRNRHVFIVASTTTPVNDNIMELLIFIDSLKRASAKTITVILTYFGYARQDRKTKGREPISSKLVADLLVTAGATKIVLVDIHNASTQGFFSVPVDNLRLAAVFATKITDTSNVVVVSPDHGGAVRARELSDLLGINRNIAIVDKRRVANNVATTLGVLGDVKDKICIILDDMIDTGGTIVKAAVILKKVGASKVIVLATHGIFSKGFDKFDESKNIDEIIVSDSIQSVYSIQSKKIKVVSLFEFVGDIINATCSGESISSVYKKFKDKIKHD